MTVNRYIFQSPYTNQVQIGRPDPSVQQQKEQQTSSGNMELNTAPNETLQEAQTFSASQEKEVEPTVKSEALLDVYA